MIPKVFQWLQGLYTKTKQPRLEAKVMCRQIQEWQEEYLRIEHELEKLKDYQKFLGMEEINEDPVRKFAAYFHVY